MDINQAIKHAEDVANSHCDACGLEHRQLANWLKQLIDEQKLTRYMAKSYLIQNQHYPLDKNIGNYYKCVSCIAYKLFCSEFNVDAYRRIRLNYPDDIEECVTKVVKSYQITMNKNKKGQ